MSVIQQFYNTDQIENHYHGHGHGHGHWFDADSKRFFNSRIGQNAYPTTNPFITLFVSSERCSWNDHFESKWVDAHITENGDIVRDLRDVFVGEKRRYSIRSYDSRTHEIDTVGEFQAYNSGKTANRIAKELALKWEFSLEDMHEFALILNLDFDQTKRRAVARGEKKFYISELGYFLVNTPLPAIV